MKIAIQFKGGSFTQHWIEYCKNTNLDYVLVDCFDTNILNIFIKEKVTHLMWHINHTSSKDLMVFPYVMNGADKMGVKTFPNFDTRWHFDDKVAQKYLFESIQAPLVKSDVFYEQSDALNFLNSSRLPVVAKLKRGAGSTNVKLISSREEGTEYIQKLFSEGIISTSTVLGNLDQKVRVAKQIKDPIKLLKKTIGFFKKNHKERALAEKEKGYVYFQEFIPNNSYDIRLIVISCKYAYGLRRINKKNDFRASGSSNFRYDNIPITIVEEAFKISKNLNLQSCAFDFVFDENRNPLVIEVSYGFGTKGSSKAPGYWTADLKWHEGNFNPQVWMIENFLNE